MFFHEIETDRLLLKNISYEDRAFILEQFSNDVINQYLFDAEPMKDLSDADELISFYLQPEPRGQHRWILMLKDTGEKMGTCGFHCWDQGKQCVEMGYDLKEQYWGKGYMTEAIEAILAFAKNEMKIRRVDAQIYKDNVNSIRLIKRVHFTQTGETKVLVFRGKEYLHDIFSLVVED